MKRIAEILRSVMFRVEDRLWPAWNWLYCEIAYSSTGWKLAIAYEDAKKFAFRLLVIAFKPTFRAIQTIILEAIKYWKYSKASRIRARQNLTVRAGWIRYRFAEGPYEFAVKSSSGVARALVLLVCGGSSIYLAEQYLPLLVKTPLVFAVIPLFPTTMAMILGTIMGLLEKNYTLADVLFPVTNILAALTAVVIIVSISITAIWSELAMIAGGGTILFLLLAANTYYHLRFASRKEVSA